jgi:uncharacterized membrane protein HdeD (DUF308 family)
MSSIAAEAPRRLARTFLPPWWLLLVTGIGWTVVGLILLRFDYTTVTAISVLFGIVAIAAGIFEIGGVRDIVLGFRIRELQHSSSN